MPFIWNKRVVPEIYLGDKKIAEVYQGKNLVLKNYDINLHNISSTSTNSGTWGLKIDSLDEPEMSEKDLEYAQAIVRSYNEPEFYFKNWYSDNELLNRVESISAKNKSNIDLYAKWVLKVPMYRYTYYTIKYSAVGNGGVGGYGDYPTSSGISVGQWQKSHSNYYNYDSPHIGQCTWYSNGRTAQMHNGNGAPWGTNGWPNAYDFANVNNDYWRGSRAVNGLTPCIGDCACFWNGIDPSSIDCKMHVVVIESISGNNATVSHWNSSDGHGGYTLTSNAPISWTLGSALWGMPFYGYCCWAGGGTSASGDYNSTVNPDAINGDYIQTVGEKVYNTSNWTKNYYETEYLNSKGTVLGTIEDTEVMYYYSIYDYVTSKWTNLSIDEP